MEYPATAATAERLANGLTLILDPDPAAPVVSVKLPRSTLPLPARLPARLPIVRLFTKLRVPATSKVGVALRLLAGSMVSL